MILVFWGVVEVVFFEDFFEGSWRFWEFYLVLKYFF